MPRIIVPRPPAEALSIRISGDEARYLTTVLRLGRGDRIVLLYEGGGRQNAEISAVERDIVLTLLDALPSIEAAPVRITLAQGVLKGHKMDMVIQKATELGTSVIVPIVTERCQVRDTRKHPRWEKIAQEAARQSLQPQAPAVLPAVGYEKFISTLSSQCSNGFVFWEEGGEPLGSGQIPEDGELIIVIGPEGGLTHAEVGQAVSAGLKTATLGPRILRAETASLVALSVIQYLSGGLGGR